MDPESLLDGGEYLDGINSSTPFFGGVVALGVIIGSSQDSALEPAVVVNLALLSVGGEAANRTLLLAPVDRFNPILGFSATLVGVAKSAAATLARVGRVG